MPNYTVPTLLFPAAPKKKKKNSSLAYIIIYTLVIQYACFEYIMDVDNIRFSLTDGAPAALVSLVGRKQYKRCARDIYYFIQVQNPFITLYISCQ